jgi:hypothetical protein
MSIFLKLNQNVIKIARFEPNALSKKITLTMINQSKRTT